MNLKHMAAAKLLCSNWSSTKLDHLLEQTDIRMSRALDYVMPNNIKVSCVQLSLKAELPFKDCMELIFGKRQHRRCRRNPADRISRVYRTASDFKLSFHL